MIRRPALEVLQHLKGLSQDATPPAKFIFCILKILLNFNIVNVGMTL